MAYLSLRKKIEEIEIIEDFNEVLSLILEIFYLDKTLLFQKKKPTKSEIEKKMFDSDLILVYAVSDSNFDSISELISLSHLILYYYTKYLNNYLNNDSIGFNLKLKTLYNSHFSLNTAAQKHYLNNRFAFVARSIFELQHTDGFIKVNIENIEFSAEQKKEMNDWFTIRYELFSELANITHNKIELLEYEKINYSGVKMNQKEGPKLLMEFIMALTMNKTFANIKRKEKELFEKSLFEFFGVELKDSSGLRINIAKRKKNKAVALQELVNSLNECDTHTKKSRTPLKKSE
jgi:hypothetical protein